MQEVDEKTIAYIRSISKYELLTAKREIELYENIHKFKSGKIRQAAIDELVKHNLKLVVKEAFRFSRKTGLGVSDFIGSGSEGLMKAAERFNPKKFKTRFSTYATYWIREAMQDLTYRDMSIVTIPVHISNGLARHKKLMENGKMNEEDLKTELKVNDAGLKRIRDAHVHIVDMNKPLVSKKGGEQSDETFGDFIADENAIDPSEESARQDDYSMLHEALAELDEKSRNVIMSRFLDSDKMQLRKLGKLHDLTGERIRQISEKALDLLRRKLSRKMGITKRG